MAILSYGFSTDSKNKKKTLQSLSIVSSLTALALLMKRYVDLSKGSGKSKKTAIISMVLICVLLGVGGGLLIYNKKLNLENAMLLGLFSSILMFWVNLFNANSLK